MSEKNIELMRRFIEAYSAHDAAALIALCDPSIELHSIFAAVGRTPSSRLAPARRNASSGTSMRAAARWTGLAGMAEGWRDWISAWEAHRVEAEECRELDAGRVLVLTHVSGRGKKSELEVGQWTKGAHLLCVRGGEVTRLVQYFDRDHALADLGLPPEGGSPAS